MCVRCTYQDGPFHLVVFSDWCDHMRPSTDIPTLAAVGLCLEEEEEEQ